MTYCVGLLLEAGVVMASDSRTNAGVDNISTFRKMRIFEESGERVMILLSAGNLAITQASVSLLEEWSRSEDDNRNIRLAPTLFRVARIVGEAIREVHRLDAEPLRQQGADFSASFILGGQIKGERPRLFNIYSAGNFIEATPETCFFQIGEIKYGKPVFDRILSPKTALDEAAKLTLISFDSTMRSNLSVGPPIDLLCYRTDSFQVDVCHRFGEGDPYMADIRRQWGEGLRRVFEGLPPPMV